MHLHTSDLNRVTRNRVKGWDNKLFFPLHIYAGKDVEPIPVLYTYSYCLRSMDGGESPTNPPLVLVIPDKVKARISHVTVSDQPFETGSEEWEKWYLRQDMIWVAHNASTPHATLTQTLANTKSECWWPGIEESIRKYYDACTMCLAQRQGMSAIGLGLQSSCRFTMLHIDDKIFSPELQALTGYVSELTMWEMATGTTVFALRKTKLAREAYHLIACRWIPYFGPPLVIKSDRDPALIGTIAKFISNQYGVQTVIETSLGDHVSGPENRHNYLSKMIMAAEAKGELQCAEQLELLVAMAQLRIDQVTLTDGATPFERRHGIKPTTAKNMISANKMTAIQINEAIVQAKPMDKEYILAVQQRCQQLIDYHNQLTEQRARYNIANRLSLEGNRNATNFGFHTGQKISHAGMTQTIISIPAPGAKALVKNAAGQETWVQIHKLRPLSTERIENPIQASPDIQPGTLIFYEDTDTTGGMLAGVVQPDSVPLEPPPEFQELQSNSYLVHVHQPTSTTKTWLPRWIHPEKPTKMIRSKTCPAGCEPMLDDVNKDQFITVGTFTGPGFCLTESTIYHLQSLGYELAMQPDNDSEN
jgi:hypothetical protein